MDKDKIIQHVGSPSRLASVLGVSRSQVSRWPASLPQRIVDQIVGALVRNSISVPDWMLTGPGRVSFEIRIPGAYAPFNARQATYEMKRGSQG